MVSFVSWIALFNSQNRYVFFNLKTGKPMNQQDFSKFSTSAFRSVAKEELNLQTVRRMLSEGKLHGSSEA
jgi:hypothetical protein